MRMGMSDDGEPHGTAGRPMLTALLHSDVGEVVAVSTRYYGGVKLGTGGLARAYSGGVVLALETLPREEKVERADVSVTVGYSHVDTLHRLIDEQEVLLRDEHFGAEVTLRLAVPASGINALRQLVADATAGSARLTVE